MKTSTKNLVIAFLLLTSSVASADIKYPYFGSPPTAAERSQATSERIADSIVGVWKLRQEYSDSSLKYRFEFNRDGSYVVRWSSNDASGNVSNSTVNGHYTINERNSTIHMVVQGNDETSRLQILGDMLLLEDVDDQVTYVFRRA